MGCGYCTKIFEIIGASEIFIFQVVNFQTSDVISIVVSTKGSDNAHFKIESYEKTGMRVTFHLDKVLKHSRPGVKLLMLEFKAYPVDRSLCVVFILKEYLSRRHL